MAAPGDDTIDGDRGPTSSRRPRQRHVDGGAGNDAVAGGDGDDTVSATTTRTPARTRSTAAPATTTVGVRHPRQRPQPAVAITFDGVANDGRPGENDNIVGVESFDASVPGTFAGGAGDDEFFVRAHFNPAESTVTGGAGNDKLKGHDHVETIDGGPGNDILEGGLNNDTLTGGPGKDTIFGDSTADTCNFLSCRIAFGNDVIDARDGEQDTIDCGVGEDRATVDAIDVVANCEQVDKSGGGRAPHGADGTPERAEALHAQGAEEGPRGRVRLRGGVHRQGHADRRQEDRQAARHEADRVRQGLDRRRRHRQVPRQADARRASGSAGCGAAAPWPRS